MADLHDQEKVRILELKPEAVEEGAEVRIVGNSGAVGKQVDLRSESSFRWWTVERQDLTEPK